jgi:hypothetical protein
VTDGLTRDEYSSSSRGVAAVFPEDEVLARIAEPPIYDAVLSSRIRCCRRFNVFRRADRLPNLQQGSFLRFLGLPAGTSCWLVVPRAVEPGERQSGAVARY